MSPHFSLWGLSPPPPPAGLQPSVLITPGKASAEAPLLKETHSEGLKYLPGNFSHLTSGDVCQTHPQPPIVAH